MCKTITRVVCLAACIWIVREYTVQASYTLEKPTLVPGIIKWNTPSFSTFSTFSNSFDSSSSSETNDPTQAPPSEERNVTTRLTIAIDMPWLNAMSVVTMGNINRIARTNLAGNFIRLEHPFQKHAVVGVDIPTGFEHYKCSTLIRVLDKPSISNTTHVLVETSAFDRNNWVYHTYNNVVRVYPSSTKDVEITSQLWIGMTIDMAFDDEWKKSCGPWIEVFQDAVKKDWFLINMVAHAWTPAPDIWYPGPSLDNNITLLVLPDASADLLLQDSSSSFGLASILPSMEIRIGAILVYPNDKSTTAAMTREDYQLQISKFEIWAVLEACYDSTTETEETFRIRIEWANSALSSNSLGPVTSLDAYGIRYNVSATDCLSKAEHPLCIKSDCHTQAQWYITNDVSTTSNTLHKPFVLRIENLNTRFVLQLQFAIVTLDTNSWIYSASILGILFFSVVCLICCGIGYESLENHCIARKEALQERELISGPEQDPIMTTTPTTPTDVTSSSRRGRHDEDAKRQQMTRSTVASRARPNAKQSLQTQKTTTGRTSTIQDHTVLDAKDEEMESSASESPHSSDSD